MVKSDYECLYDKIASLLPIEYSTSFGYTEEISIDTNNITIATTKLCAIYFKSGMNGNREVDDGQYVNESVRVTLNIYGENTITGISNCLSYCESAKDTLDSTYNLKFTDNDSSKVLIIMSMVRQGNINFVGRNSQGIPVYSINYIMNYSKGGI